MSWTCPRCGAPFANAIASHACVVVGLDEHFEVVEPGFVRDDAFAALIREAAAGVGRRGPRGG